MRKVTIVTCSAFEANNEINFSNTDVRIDSFKKFATSDSVIIKTVGLYLHNNLIARKRYENDVLVSFEITNAGWQSNTTKERLNGLNGVSIYEKKGQWYLNGKKWDGEWVNVAKWNEENNFENNQ